MTAPGFAHPPRFVSPLRVVRVERAAEGGYNVVAKWKATEEPTLTPTPTLTLTPTPNPIPNPTPTSEQAAEQGLKPGTLRRSLSEHASRRRVDPRDGQACTREELMLG